MWPLARGPPWSTRASRAAATERGRAQKYDNLRSAVLERQGDAIRLHPRLLELCGHYHFVPRPCAVAAAHEKAQASYCNSSRICGAH